MTLLDRYILRSFFFNLILWLFCIIGIYIVFDLFTNVDGLVKAGKALGNVPMTILTYYLFKSIPIAMSLGSILGLVSAMITIAMMMRHNELIPIQAAGVSTIRIIMPLIGAVLIVTVGSTVLREMVLPHYLNELVMDVSTLSEDRGNMVNATIDNETGITLQGDRIFRRTARISNPNFVLHKPLVRQVTYLRAKEAFHRPAGEGRPAGFMLVELRDIPELLKDAPLKYGEKPIVLMHRDAPDWIEPGNGFVASNVPFDYLASNDAWRQYASTPDLIRAVRNGSLDLGSRIHASIHGRVMQPFLDMTLLFLGLPVILRSGDRNIFKSLGLSGLLILTFLVVRESCQFLGGSGDMPVLGAWLPMMIFLPIAVNQFMMLREK